MDIVVELFRTMEIREKVRVDDGMGGWTEDWTTVGTVEGVLDLMAQSDNSYIPAQKALERSTHIFICDTHPEVQQGRWLKDGDKYFEILDVDNPVEGDHHLEVYLEYRSG